MNTQSMLPEGLYRSTSDKMLAGVCGGIAQRYGWDPTIVRLAVVGLGIIAHVATLVIYIALAFMLPKDYTA